MPKVLLADDLDLIRNAIKRILRKEPSIQVVGEAATFEQLVAMVADLKPNIVLLDLSMPGADVDPDIVRIKLCESAQHVLAFSIWTDQEAQELAKRYGSTELLDKASLSLTLLPAIQKLPLSRVRDIGLATH
jgi:two-component system, NarL family, invasion response regulator UvrY